MHRHLSICFIFVLVLTAAAGTRAQDPSPTLIPTPLGAPDAARPENLNDLPAIAPGYRSDVRSLPDLGRVGVDMTQQRTLTMREALELALENNKDIEVSRQTAVIAEFDLRAAQGFYQPRLTGQTSYERSTLPNVSIFSNNTTTTQSSIVGNAAIQAFYPKQGTVLAGTFNNQSLRTNNPISILSPQLNSSLGVSLTQPLFRGRRFDQPRRIIEIAKRNIALTDTQFRQRSMEVVAGVQRAYWDLTYALRNLQVQRDTVRDARSQLEHNRRLVEEGQLAPIDIVAAETQVATFEQAVYEALNGVNQAENVLKNLISPNRDDRLWSEALVPVESVEAAVTGTTLAEAMEIAVDNRPELEINNEQRNINAIDQKLYRDQKKPQIDLVASYNTSGIGGSQNPTFSPTFGPCAAVPPDPVACAQQQALQQANLATLTGNPFSGIFANRYPIVRVGVNFNIPLFGDKTADAQLGRALVEGERLETQREQIEQGIQVEVRNAMQGIRTGEARLRSAAIARENIERQYQSEQRKLDEGQSDVYRVLERQTALAAARSNELRARIELNKAIAELDRATGRTLAANDIEAKLPR